MILCHPNYCDLFDHLEHPIYSLDTLLDVEVSSCETVACSAMGEESWVTAAVVLACSPSPVVADVKA